MEEQTEQTESNTEAEAGIVSEGFTAETIAGETVTIAHKEYEGDRLVFITDQGAKYVSPASGAMELEPFNPDKHIGGQPVTGEATANLTESISAEEAAEAEKELAEAELNNEVTPEEAAEKRQAIESGISNEPAEEEPTEETEETESEETEDAA